MLSVMCIITVIYIRIRISKLAEIHCYRETLLNIIYLIRDVIVLKSIHFKHLLKLEIFANIMFFC